MDAWDLPCGFLVIISKALLCGRFIYICLLYYISRSVTMPKIQLDITEAQSKKLAFYKLAFNFRTKADAVRYILDHASKSKIEV